MILVVMGISIWSLAVAIGQSHEVNPPLASDSATVISERIDNTDPYDRQVWVDVWFRTKSGQIAHATIQPYPYVFGKVVRGQKIPIQYNVNVPSQAEYAGWGGDVQNYWHAGAFEWPAYFGAVAWLCLAAVLLLTGSSWLTGIMRAAQGVVATPVRLRTSGEMVYADEVADSYSLEWRILPGQPDVSGYVRILGEIAGGRWLVVCLDDGQFVWPRSKAQPQLIPAMLRLPVVQPGRVGSVRLLLAGYAQIADLLGMLPVVIRRPPQPKTGRWVLGALRPAVRALVTMHMRRRLAALGSALLRASLLCDESDSQSRRMLAEASDECRVLAGALPRRSVIAVLATIAATILSILSPFLLMPHVGLSVRFIGRFIVQDAPLLSAGALIFGAVPLRMFVLSARWKRELFSPASATITPAIIEPAVNDNLNWNAYELEQAAFTAAAVQEPSDWESSIIWLPITIYIATILMPFAFGGAIIILPVPGQLDSTFVFPFVVTLIAFSYAVKIYKWWGRVRALRASLVQRGPARDIAGHGGEHAVSADSGEGRTASARSPAVLPNER